MAYIRADDSRTQSFLILCYAMNAFELHDAQLPFRLCGVRFSVDVFARVFFSSFKRINKPFSMSINKHKVKRMPASRDILFVYGPNHWTETFSMVGIGSWSMLEFRE